ncbi:MAG: TonB-dependent receptor [Cyanobacteria bacterium SW_9_44_58]|nr:MAG: TonB-dependent receptor [Cyanobacteria bacterium SW_9_44_58]
MQRSQLILALFSGICIAQPVQAQTIEIQNITLEPTSSGFNLILETSGDRNPQTFTTRYGNTLAIDIVNTQLQGEAYESNNPVPNIEKIQVSQRYSNSIRVEIIGTNQSPEVNITSNGNIQVAVNPPQETTAQDTPESPRPTPQPSPTTQQEPIELVVTATRTEEDPQDIPRSISVLNREDIEEQANLSQDLQDILKQVPGVAPPNQQNDPGNFLRGRTAQVLIDGVLVRSNLSTVQARDLRSIAPSAIEKIEVLRGPTAIYGDGATGGVINIITRGAGEEDFSASTELGITGALGDLDEDSIGNTQRQSLFWNQENFDVTLNLSRTFTGTFFDAEGDPISSDLQGAQANSNSEKLNFLGKVGIDFNSQQRLQLTVNHFEDNQNVPIASMANPEPGIQKAVAVEQPRDYVDADEPQNINTAISLQYNHDDLLNSELQAQLFYRDNQNIFDAQDFRPFNETIARGRNEKEQWGTRLQVDTPISEQASVLWGLDYTDEAIAQPFERFDESAFLDDGTVRKVDEVTFIPPYDFNTFGLFAQGEWDVSDRVTLRGGLRYERFNMSVDDYTVEAFRIGNPLSVQGGEVDFDDVTFNIGTVFDITDTVNVFASFSQGFSAPDFGRFLRSPGSVRNISEDVIDVQPQVVDNYEIGVRGNWDSVQASLVGFFNNSDLGVEVLPPSPDSDTGLSEVQRLPTRIFGLEATVDWQANSNWQLGGGLTWLGGESDSDDDGDFERPLNSSRIPPIKLTAYVENQTLPGWRNRLQLFALGDRDLAADRPNPSDPVPVDGYIILDYISSIKFGGGTLQLGIENLLDEQFFPVDSQLSGGSSEQRNKAGRGRTFTLQYQYDW